MHNKGGRASIEGNQIRATLPYIRVEVPVVIIFRALGTTDDRSIIEHVVYDLMDGEMMDLFRPSLEEAFVIQKQEVALDYIGKRGSAQDITKEEVRGRAFAASLRHLAPHANRRSTCC